MPYARHTDPTTSHQAAASVDETQLGAVKQAIVKLLRLPMTDEQLISAYQEAAHYGLVPKQSESGIRTRRNDVYQLGYIEQIGYGQTKTGRQAIIWKATK